MKTTEAILEGIYERDSSSDAFIIAVSTERYRDIFNELDPAPFKKRDINHDLRVFLEDSSDDIPLKYDLILQFNLLKENPDQPKEQRITSGLRTYFYFVENQLRQEIGKSYQKGALYFVTAFILLFVTYTLRTAATSGTVFTILVEAITIGGWVFLWEAISTFAFKKRDVRRRKQHYERFTRAQIRFNYNVPKPPNPD